MQHWQSNQLGPWWLSERHAITPSVRTSRTYIVSVPAGSRSHCCRMTGSPQPRTCPSRALRSHPSRCKRPQPIKRACLLMPGRLHPGPGSCCHAQSAMTASAACPTGPQGSCSRYGGTCVRQLHPDIGVAAAGRAPMHHSRQRRCAIGCFVSLQEEKAAAQAPTEEEDYTTDAQFLVEDLQVKACTCTCQQVLKLAPAGRCNQHTGAHFIPAALSCRCFRASSRNSLACHPPTYWGLLLRPSTVAPQPGNGSSPSRQV
jgi:hypothetical protein